MFCEFKGVFSLFLCEMTRSVNHGTYTIGDSGNLIQYHGTVLTSIKIDLLDFEEDQAKALAALESTTPSQRRLILVSGSGFNLQHPVTIFGSPARKQKYLKEVDKHIKKIMKLFAER